LARDFDRRALMMRGDPLRLRQAVGNLVSNAVKFTDDSGTVTVRLRAAADGVTVQVHDTGVGISPGDLPHVFEPFHKGNPNTRTNRQGVGLGLNIARYLVVLHQGRLEIESRSGEGMLVTLWLPVERMVEE
jgi:signal transduction histidine kinase